MCCSYSNLAVGWRNAASDLCIGTVTVLQNLGSGGFRNLERGVLPLVCEVCLKNFFWVTTLTSGHINAFMTHAIIVVAS